ncbi:hypothetical protein [Blastococcus sp. SYSU DS0617]
MSLPMPDRAASRLPPVPGLIAAPLAVFSGLVPGFFVLVVVGFSGGRLSGLEWLLLVVPLALTLGLLVGAVLLLLGRSWRVVAVSGAVLGLLIIGGTLFAGWAENALGLGISTGLFPALTAVLASLPSVRAWVAARRA